MFDEDFCSRSSPDLWKESLDCQHEPETQVVKKIVTGSSDDESAEGQRSDDLTYDSDATNASSDYDGIVSNLNNNSRIGAESVNKLRSSSTRPSNSEPVNPTQAGIYSQVPGCSNMLTQANDGFREESTSPKSSRNRASNKKDILIIPDTSESDSDSFSGKKILNDAKKLVPSLKNKANFDSDINNSDDNNDVDKKRVGGKQLYIAKKPAPSLKNKVNSKNDITSSDDEDGDDDIKRVGGKRLYTAKKPAPFLKNKVNSKNDINSSDDEDEDDDRKRVGRKRLHTTQKPAPLGNYLGRV